MAMRAFKYEVEKMAWHPYPSLINSNYKKQLDLAMNLKLKDTLLWKLHNQHSNFCENKFLNKIVTLQQQ